MFVWDSRVYVCVGQRTVCPNGTDRRILMWDRGTCVNMGQEDVCLGGWVLRTCACVGQWDVCLEENTCFFGIEGPVHVRDKKTYVFVLDRGTCVGRKEM